MRTVALEEHFTVPSLVRRIQPAMPSAGVVSAQEPPCRAASTHSTCCPKSAPRGSTPWTIPGSASRCCQPRAPVPICRWCRGRRDRTRNERRLGRGDRASSRPLRRLCAPADARARSRRQGAGPRRSDARLSRRAHQRHDKRIAFSTIPRFEPILAAAEELDVPIYLHPHLAPEAVRKALLQQSPVQRRLRAGGGRLGLALGNGIHVLRLVLSGTLDRHPEAQAHHRSHGRGPAGHAGALRPGVRGLYPAPRPADQPHHSRPGLDHDQRHVQPAAVPCGAADVRHRSDPVSPSTIPMLPNERGRPSCNRWRCRRPIWPSSPTATPTACSSSARVHTSAASRLNDRLARAGTAPRRTGHPRRAHYVSAPKS